MDRLEQDLRRLLRDPPRSPASAPDVTERVRSGMARRRVRRHTVAASAVALAMAVAAGVSAVLIRDGRTTSTSSDTVPWLDAPVAPYTSPPPVRSSAKPTARACGRADLRLVGIDTEGATGHTGNFVQVENAGPSRCTLSGSPKLSGLDRAGTRATIRAESGTFFDSPDSQERPATIDPHERATLTIETSMSCNGGAPASTTTYRQVQIRLPDGTSFDVANRLDSSCPFRIGTWYRPVQPPPEPPEPWAALQARLTDVPTTVRAGRPFDYVVELTNAGSTDIVLDPCPAYTQAVGDTSTDYQLNCAAASAIRTGESMRFGMRLNVDAHVTPGPTKMSWSLHGSTVAAAAEITVTP